MDHDPSSSGSDSFCYWCSVLSTPLELDAVYNTRLHAAYAVGRHYHTHWGPFRGCVPVLIRFSDHLRETFKSVEFTVQVMSHGAKKEPTFHDQ